MDENTNEVPKVLSQIMLGCCEDSITEYLHDLVNKKEIFDFSVRANYDTGEVYAEMKQMNRSVAYATIRAGEYGVKQHTKKECDNEEAKKS